MPGGRETDPARPGTRSPLGGLRTRRAPARGFLAAVLVAVVLALYTDAAADKPQAACAIVKACGLVTTISVCSIEQSRPLDGVTYDAARCAEPSDLLAHGVTPESGIGSYVYDFLGRRYRVVFEIKGEAAISLTRFDYLAENLPLAAKLATKLSTTRYVISYLDRERRRFHAERADKLTGDAEMLFLDRTLNQRVYYGWGASKFGPWKLRGSAYVDIRVRQSVSSPNAIAYDLRIRTAPVNAFVNAIMKMGIFKGHVIGQIEDTMKDLIGAAGQLTPANLGRTLEDAVFDEDERAKIRALSSLP